MVFAVWGWIIANARDGEVEINPRLLASVLGESREDVIQAVDFLCSPDPDSRTAEEDGRRLVKEGPFLYRVVTWEKYRKLLQKEAWKEAERERKRKARASKDVRKCPDTSGEVPDTPVSVAVDASDSAFVSESEAASGSGLTWQRAGVLFFTAMGVELVDVPLAYHESDLMAVCRLAKHDEARLAKALEAIKADKWAKVNATPAHLAKHWPRYANGPRTEEGEELVSFASLRREREERERQKKEFGF